MQLFLEIKFNNIPSLTHLYSSRMELYIINFQNESTWENNHLVNENNKYCNDQQHNTTGREQENSIYQHEVMLSSLEENLALVSVSL